MQHTQTTSTSTRRAPDDVEQTTTSERDGDAAELLERSDELLDEIEEVLDDVDDFATSAIA